MKHRIQISVLSALAVLIISQTMYAQSNPDPYSVWVTGRNIEGQLGVDAMVENSTSLLKLNEGSKAIAAGDKQTYFIDEDDNLWASGSNEFGQLGDGTTDNRTEPVPVLNGTNVEKIIAGRNHGLFIKEDGTLWAMGRNEYGQLGDGTTTDRFEPIQVTTDVITAAGGESHTMILKDDGSLWGVGRNNFGQLGDGSTTDRLEAVKIDDNVARVSAGWHHTFYANTSGDLLAMGDNAYGKLGIGETAGSVAFKNEPTPVVNGTQVVSISLKSDNSYFIRSNGRLYSVGNNEYGQLGDGTRIDKATPVQVRNGTNVTAVAAGGGHGIFVRQDSTMWVVGSTQDGKLAFDGSDEQKLPLSAFNLYKGDTHVHSVYSWSHGSHRSGSNYSDLEPGWDPPPGTGSGEHEYPPVLQPMGVVNPSYYKNNTGPPAYQFQKAKNNGYHFAVSADHSQEHPFQPVDSDNNEYWLDTREAARFYYDDPTFVGMTGIEFSRNSDPNNTGSGHLNPFNIHDYKNAMGPEAISIPELYEWLKTARPLDDKGHIVLQFNHPSRTQYNDWAHWDEQIVDIVTMFELRTVFRNTPRWTAYVRSLNKGWKTSPISVHDSHGYWNISQIIPLVNVYAPELTIEALTRAMRQRRTYTSWTELHSTDVELIYSVNDHVMGSTLDSPTTFDFDIRMKVNPLRSTQYVKRIQILRDHSSGNLDETEVVAEKIFDGTSANIEWKMTVEDATAKYFLLRVHSWNDMGSNSTTYNTHGSTYSAPVWTGRGPKGDGTHEIHHAVDGISTPIQVATQVVKVAAGSGHTVALKPGATLTSIDGGNSTELPAKVNLLQNYPNPFNPVTTVEYILPNEAYVNLEVFNMLGQKVATLVNELQSPGVQKATFDATNLSSGMYLYRIQAGSYVETKKMMLIK